MKLLFVVTSAVSRHKAWDIILILVGVVAWTQRQRGPRCTPSACDMNQIDHAGGGCVKRRLRYLNPARILKVPSVVQRADLSGDEGTAGVQDHRAENEREERETSRNPGLFRSQLEA